MVRWARERWHEGWLSVELLLLSQLPLQSCLSTPADCVQQHVRTSGLYACVRGVRGFFVHAHHMFQSPAAFSSLSQTDGQMLGGDAGGSLKPCDATVILHVIYVPVSHITDLSQSAGFIKLRVTTDVTANHKWSFLLNWNEEEVNWPEERCLKKREFPGPDWVDTKNT